MSRFISASRVQMGADGTQQIPVEMTPPALPLPPPGGGEMGLLEDLLDDAQPVIHGNGRATGSS